MDEVKQKAIEFRSQFRGEAKYVVLEIIEESKLYEFSHPILLSNRLEFWRKVKQELENDR